ncbi:P-loop containing nucleoside triphosphate hydrolase protein [Xylona heveae TC161]|uniref:DNA 3'-5' helicase n=1 Tax=Xylona heveae (strain CBS 132557 / TC161) TaxID=1328760 RepID=A0A165I0K5_XYLHT|nr:P-loop containing nucleoside triphosphate hydrolase protein [Xylona heveae TC161]KZF24190.1 P-loop containing nucleoside triphosphate hydrolase protein [Xylona heveae TC161]
MDTILHGLNGAQRTAVTSPASVLQILAPPGSGKTKTLTARVAYLLAHDGLDPTNIIVTTFTIKAAREMGERVRSLVGDDLGKKLVLGTFHSICRRYLAVYGHLIGIQRRFGIADSSDSLGIIKRIIKRLKLNIDPAATRTRISNSKAKGISHDDVTAKNHTSKILDQQEFAIAYREYELTLAQSNLLDFDDLLVRCVELLQQHPKCVSKVQAVLIDEFQDTNHIQFELMCLLSQYQKRITIVGDPDQSIYGFRSAEIENLKRMQQCYPDTLTVFLEQNYRSSGSILLSAMEVIQQDSSRPNNNLIPTHCVGTRPVLRKLHSAATEALWIVTEIKRSLALTGSLLRLSDFAILVRSAFLSRHIESACGKAGIAYRMVGGWRFYDRLEIKILLDYLRIISHPGNSDALARIINVPSRRIGETTIKNLLEEAETNSMTLWALISGVLRGNLTSKIKFTKVAQQGLSSLSNLIIESRQMLSDCTKSKFNLVDLLENVMKKLAYKEFLEKTHSEDHESRWANVQELVAQASDFSLSIQNGSDEDESLPEVEELPQQKPTSFEDGLARFLANVALSSEIKPEDAQAGINDQVVISTIHAAKGLEWPVVFIPGAYQGSIPHSRSDDMDEERRLLYVAMTRAKALLYLSCPTKNSNQDCTKLSQFLSSETLAALLQNKGPSFTSVVAGSLAQILGRSCPPKLTLPENHGLKSLEDDIWPLNGEMVANNGDRHDGLQLGNAQHAGERWSTKFTSLERHKLSAPGAEQYKTSLAEQSLPITMQRDSSFSISNTTIQNGFISAGQHSQNAGLTAEPSRRESHTDLENRTGCKSSTKPSRLPGLPEIGEKSAAIAGARQSRLTSFFAKPGSVQNKLDIVSNFPRSSLANSRLDTDMVSTHVPYELPNLPCEVSYTKKARGTSNSEDNFSQRLQEEHSTIGAIPLSLSRHRPRAPVPRKPLAQFSQEPASKRKAYTFLSSSPPPFDQSKQVAAEAEQAAGDLQKDIPKQSIEQEIPSGIRPAKTFHNTTIAALNSSNGTMRRTLGVRRSMNGWSDKGNKAFAVPAKRNNPG